MSLEIIWGPSFNQDKKTKKWSIRAKINDAGQIKEYRKRGCESKKAAKIIWLDYLAENQDESIGITDKRVRFEDRRFDSAVKAIRAS